MDIPIDFNEYKFDPTPYTHSISMLAKKIEDGNFEANKCSMSTLNQIDALIAEKNEECSRVSEEIKNVRNENVKLQMELDSLKKEEEELSSAHNDLKEGIIWLTIFYMRSINTNFVISFVLLFFVALKSVCKVTFVQDNEHFRAITQKIQKSLGFKLKLLQSQDNQHLWTATFLYEANESESNHYVNVLYNNETSTFTCTYHLI